MKPDAGAFDAARKDVLNPWQHGVTQVFKGSFGTGGSNTRRFRFDLTLDGRLTAKLRGPRQADYNLAFTSNGKSEGRTSTPGARDSVSYQAACRTDALEHVVVTVKRSSGSGPFTLRMTYAG
jgi:hypothetical protein